MQKILQVSSQKSKQINANEKITNSTSKVENDYAKNNAKR